MKVNIEQYKKLECWENDKDLERFSRFNEFVLRCNLRNSGIRVKKMFEIYNEQKD